VYVADAALLLEQSVGRLVRKEDDSGLVAVLDPRLTDCMISYGTETRNKYDEATRYFISSTDDYAEALQYLKDRGQLLTAS
jgi:ATP-dependent DNA helicase DinG